MPDLPRLALSIRQPWAWAIINAGKDIENRSWQAMNHGLSIRGNIAIHASLGMTKGEYEAAALFMASIGIKCPPPHELDRGGIIGLVDVVGEVQASNSPWFFGPRGLVLENAEPCDFIPCKGALGYFSWRKSLCKDLPAMAKWMLPVQEAKPAADLFGGAQR